MSINLTKILKAYLSTDVVTSFKSSGDITKA